MAKDNYKKTYFDYYGYDRGDWIECECGICGKGVVDIHHLKIKGMGGTKEKAKIEDLVGVSRECHDRAHDDPEYNEYLKQKHLENL